MAHAVTAQSGDGEALGVYVGRGPGFERIIITSTGYELHLAPDSGVVVAPGLGSERMDRLFYESIDCSGQGYVRASARGVLTHTGSTYFVTMNKALLAAKDLESKNRWAVATWAAWAVWAA